MTGILIAVEGIDGAGKTTQVQLLADFLAKADDPPVRSKEPTDGPWGRRIRASASNGRMSPAEELQAFTEDRKQHVREVIRPALDAGKTVVLDRYLYSTIAYQGTHGYDHAALTEQMLAIAPEPDVVLLLDVPPEVGLARIAHGRGETPNSFESFENLRAVRAGFLRLARERPNVRLIDGTPPMGDVHERILRTLLDDALKAKMCAKPWGCDEMLCSYRYTATCRWAEFRKLVNAASMPSG